MSSRVYQQSSIFFSSLGRKSFSHSAQCVSDSIWCWSAEEYFQKRHTRKNEPVVLPVGGLIIFVKSYSCGEDQQAYVLIKIIRRLPWQSSG